MNIRVTKSIPELPSVQRGPQLTVRIDGQPVAAFEGETVAAVLLAEGIRAFRRTRQSGEPRGIFCGMGICFDCLVTVNGEPNIRACLTSVEAGMNIETHNEVKL